MICTSCFFPLLLDNLYLQNGAIGPKLTNLIILPLTDLFLLFPCLTAKSFSREPSLGEFNEAALGISFQEFEVNVCTKY